MVNYTCITYDVIATSIGYKSYFELTKDAPYRGIYCEYCGETLPLLLPWINFNPSMDK